MIKSENKKFVLGDTPKMLSQQSCATKLNSELNRCEDIGHCYLLDLAGIFRTLSREQREQYLIDQFHLTNYGSEKIAVEIGDLLKSK